MRIATRRHLPAALLVLALAAPATAQEAARDWKPLASSLQPGTRIELDLEDGTHVDGTVLAHEGDLFVFSPKTRIPVAPWRVALFRDPVARRQAVRPGHEARHQSADWRRRRRRGLPAARRPRGGVDPYEYREAGGGAATGRSAI